MPAKTTVGIVQMCATAAVEGNLDRTLALVADAARAGAAVVPDPWGDIVAECDAGDGFALADIDPARVAEVRNQLPSLANRGMFE